MSINSLRDLVKRDWMIVCVFPIWNTVVSANRHTKIWHTLSDYGLRDVTGVGNGLLSATSALPTIAAVLVIVEHQHHQHSLILHLVVLETLPIHKTVKCIKPVSKQKSISTQINCSNFAFKKEKKSLPTQMHKCSKFPRAFEFLLYNFFF